MHLTWRLPPLFKAMVLLIFTRRTTKLRSRQNVQFTIVVITSGFLRYMPPTIPVLGRPCIAVVFSQLIVDGEHRGIRPFIVTINDGQYMSKGITAK